MSQDEPEVTGENNQSSLFFDAVYNWFDKRGLFDYTDDNTSIEELESRLDKLQKRLAHGGPYGIYKEITKKGDFSLLKTESAVKLINSLINSISERITDQINLLKNEQNLTGLKDKISTLNLSEQDKKDLSQQIDDTQSDLKDRAAQTAVNKKERWELELELEKYRLETEREANASKMDIEQAESRAKIRQRFFERESIASISGAVLLFVLILLIGISKFWNISMPDILGNVLLVIVGFFFGQSKGSGSKE